MPATVTKKKATASAAPAAPGLNRLSARVKINSPSTPVKKDEIPIVRFEGDTMKRYNAAVASMKDAEAVIKELQPAIRQEAMQIIFENNCQPGTLNMMTSVKLQDVAVNPEAEEGDPNYHVPGEVARVSFTSKYNNADTAQVEAAFAEMPGRDVNNYVSETLAASFDSSVFLDAEGNFNQKVYDKFRVAIERVAAELGLKTPEGAVNSPLKTKRVLNVKDEFHAKRFSEFSVEENFTLSKVLPNTIQIVAVRTV